MFIKDEKIGSIEKEIRRIREDISVMYLKVSALYDVWLPTDNKKEEEIPEAEEQLEIEEPKQPEQQLISMKEFAQKYNMESVTKCSAYCHTLRTEGILTNETAPVIKASGNVKRVYLTPEGEEILLNRLKTIKVRQKKRISEMTREELIRTIYQQNKKLRDSNKK